MLSVVNPVVKEVHWTRWGHVLCDGRSWMSDKMGNSWVPAVNHSYSHACSHQHTTHITGYHDSMYVGGLCDHCQVLLLRTLLQGSKVCAFSVKRVFEYFNPLYRINLWVTGKPTGDRFLWWISNDVSRTVALTETCFRFEVLRVYPLAPCKFW